MPPRKQPAAKPPRKKTARRPARFQAHEFTLYFEGRHDEMPDEFLDALYEAGCDDALVGTVDGVLRISFHREAPSFRIALLSAIADIELAGLGLELSRVECE